jgi:two-component system sensor histidine kinase RpfC
MLLAGEMGVMLYCIYPWVVIGNGFRYGRWNRHYSQAVALAGFLAVMLLSCTGGGTPCSAPRSFVLIAILFYVSMLLARLHAARA